MRAKARIKGKVTVIVLGPDGRVKRFPRSMIRKFLGLPGRQMRMVNHNIVTDEGDALIADLLSQTPTRTKVDNTNGKIIVGDGWTGSGAKSMTWVNSLIGTAQALDATYPKQKGTFGGTDDNVVQYYSTIAPGQCTGTGLDEVAIVNGSTHTASVDCLAYAQITPAVDKAAGDTLQIQWELTVLGS